MESIWKVNKFNNCSIKPSSIKRLIKFLLFDLANDDIQSKICIRISIFNDAEYSLSRLERISSVPTW